MAEFMMTTGEVQL